VQITVRSASDVPWADVASVMSTPGDPRTCWCQYFKVTNAVFESMTTADKTADLRTQTTGGPTPGLIAYADGEPAGWVSVEPRINFPRLFRSRAAASMAQPPDAASIWSIVCFVVAQPYRRQGVGNALLDAAVEHARASGATSIEAYPVDVAEITGSPGGYLYHGTVSMFRAAGFADAADAPAIRHVMTLSL
jgi:ribosomal protein S18 acetylase RimI-like enzyme